MLDQQFNSLVQDTSDHNSYAYGRIGHLNVVIACLPAGVADTVTAATVASQMLRSFQSIKIGLMVGVGGGVPTPHKDIRLGDVVVSKPAGQSGGVVQYDRGKKTAGGVFEKTGMLNKSPAVLLNALNKLRAEFERHVPQVEELLTETLWKTSPWMLDTYCRPDAVDKLYRPDYDHPRDRGDCTACDPQKLLRRSQRTELKIHSGTIASGNSVIKDAAERDKISKDLGGILCFETEAAGLMDGFPCLVIRGICDYADSHKNKQWQRFAAATAAVYAKMLVAMMPPSEVEKTQAAQQIISHYDHLVSGTSTPLGQRSLSPSERSLSFQQGPSPPLSASSSPLLQRSLPPSGRNSTFQQGLCPSEKFRREDFGQKLGDLERKPLPRESVGYKQPAGMYRPQRPTKSYSDQSGQPTQYHYSPSIPLHPLPGLESKPIGRTTPCETPLGLAADYYFGPQDMDGDSQHENTKIRSNHGNNQHHSNKNRGNRGNSQHHSNKNSGDHGDNQYYSDRNSGNHNGLEWGNQHIDGHNQDHSNKISGHHNKPSSGHHTGYEGEADHDDDVDNSFISGTGPYSGHHGEGEDESVDNSLIPRSGPYGGHHDEGEDESIDNSLTPRSGPYGGHHDEGEDESIDKSLTPRSGLYNGHHDESEDENIDNSPTPRSGPYDGHHDEGEDESVDKSPTPRSGLYSGHHDESEDENINNSPILHSGPYNGHHDEGEDKSINNSSIPYSGPYNGHHDEGEDENVDKSPTPRAGSYGGHDDESDDEDCCGGIFSWCCSMFSCLGDDNGSTRGDHDHDRHDY